VPRDKKKFLRRAVERSSQVIMYLSVSEEVGRLWEVRLGSTGEKGCYVNRAFVCLCSLAPRGPGCTPGKAPALLLHLQLQVDRRGSLLGLLDRVVVLASFV